MSLARFRALIVLSVLGFIAAVTIVWVIANDSQSKAPAEVSCTLKKLVNTTIPDPGQVSLSILNATDVDNLASNIRDQLAERGFGQAEVGNVSSVGEDKIQVLYGPAGAGAAQLIRANVPGAVARPDRREDGRVELVLGDGDVVLTPEHDVATALRKLGKPPLPKPICSKSEKEKERN